MISIDQLKRFFILNAIATLAASGIYNTETKPRENNSAISLTTLEAKLGYSVRKDFPYDALELDEMTTRRELSEACRTQYKTGIETGGTVYEEEIGNRNIHTRMGFKQKQNSVEDDSEARRAIETGIPPDLDRLEKELTEKHATGKCSKYNADNDWRRTIDGIRVAIEISRDDKNKDQDQYMKLAEDVEDLNKSSYRESTTPIKLAQHQREIGSFHTHPYLGGFSPVDHCIFDNSETIHYVVGCDLRNKRYQVFRLKDRIDVTVAKGDIILDN